METSARKKEAAVSGKSGAGSYSKRRRISEDSSDLSDVDDDTLQPEASPTMLRPRQRQSYLETGSDEDVCNDSEGIRPDERAAVKRRRPTDESNEGEITVSMPAQGRRVSEKSRLTKASGTSTRSANVVDLPLGEKPNGFVDVFSGKLHRANTERKTVAARASSDSTKATTSHKAKKAKKTSRLEGGQTVIIGAGIVGLFTAYELASRCEQDGIRHAITVVDIREEVASLASGLCAGFLTRRGMPKEQEWLSILKEAQQGWQDALSVAGSNDIGFIGENTFFAGVTTGDDEGESMPDWFKPRPTLHVSEDTESIGRIDTPRMAAWLKGRCNALGVDFQLGKILQAVEANTKGKGYRVSIRDHAEPFGDQSTKVSCTDIVIAAGPFSTYIARHVFNNNEKTGLQNRCQEYVWLDLELDSPSAKDEVGFTAQTTDAWSAGSITLFVRPGSEFIEISAAARNTDCLNLGPSQALNVPEMGTQQLADLAAQYLSPKYQRKLANASGGGAVVSVAKAKRPYVGPLRMRTEKSADMREIQHVWLSYGYGRYGTTLAPGAARMVVEMMAAQR